ncbi:hypothetical protein SteCoe_33904 [Stentor coeruleus]|uniref:Myb-like DNA-binding domain containing protein n=1 Tax=Stentor coeruleus TaxID=5963 RepID=A0A1R2AVP3_9CILI|nr:hypothetical protein SteCoe_33904 [Stentor coeruleus]
MDPNLLYFFNSPHIFPYLFQNGYTPAYSPLPLALNPSVTEEKPEKVEKIKYQRTWNKMQVEEVFNLAIQYCQKTKKNIEKLSLNDFGIIAIGLPQTPEQVMLKVKEIIANGTLRPGKWSQNEDEMLRNLINCFGCKWGKIACMLNKEVHNGLNIRNSKTCKERWNNYLNPSINRNQWNDNEDILLLEGFLKYGNKWSIIAKLVPDRIQGLVKNRVKSLLHKIRQNSNENGSIHHKIKAHIELRKSQTEFHSNPIKLSDENLDLDI